MRVSADRAARRRLRVPVERRYPLGSGHARRKRAGVAQVRVRIRRAAARKLRRAALRRAAATARITVRVPGDTRRSTRPLTLVPRR